jgi:hypothetical protein
MAAITAAASFVFPPRQYHHHHLQQHQNQGWYGGIGSRRSSSSSGDSTTTTTSTTNTQPLEFHYRIPLEDSYYNQVLYSDTITSASTNARTELENLLGNPREPNEARFQWDPWFVRCDQGRDRNRPSPLPGDNNDNNNHAESWDPIPGEREAAARQVQYSMTRAQCSAIFSDQVYEELIENLTELGRSIGCCAISPPWISLYGDGQMQNFHIDPKQGNMAWTLSLSVGYGTTFTGGETILLTPGVLDYWRDFDGSRGKEAPSLVRFLPPLFGRFTAFDPRVPHMVQKVSASGVGPLDARIMIHGWFAEPETTWFGEALEESDDAGRILNDCLESIMEALSSSEIGRVIGFLSVRLTINPDGSVDAIDAVCDTLREDPADSSGVVGYDEEGREVVEDSTADVRLTVREALGNLKFPPTKLGGAVVVPFDFV